MFDKMKKVLATLSIGLVFISLPSNYDNLYAERDGSLFGGINIFTDFDFPSFIVEQFFPDFSPLERDGRTRGNTVDESADIISSMWNINVVTDPTEEIEDNIEFYGIDYEPLSPDLQKVGVDHLINTLEIYPSELFNGIPEVDLMMVESLTSEGSEYIGFYLPPNLVLVVYDEYEPLDWFKDTVHHELFHYLEQEISFVEYMRSDREWEDMSEGCAVQYNAEGWEESAVSNNYIPPECYASWYGTSMPSEDRAEVAGQLLVTFSHQDLTDRASEDRVLAEKVEDIKQFYYDASDGKMNEAYWQIVEEGGVYESNRPQSQVTAEKLVQLTLCPQCSSRQG